MAVFPFKFLKAGVPGILGLVLLCLVLGCSSGGSEERTAPAKIDRILQDSWGSYVGHFISPAGRVVIPERPGESISEAQAYALLRAVWANDPATFSRVYAWTWRHLSRQEEKGDALLAWRWGKDKDGVRRVLDWNTATDGDLDYALALVLAAPRSGKCSCL